MITPQYQPVLELDPVAMDAARQRWADRAKPPGSLGRIEDLAVHLAGITGHCPPPVPSNPAVAVFAGDHGVVADGASAWPSEVTTAMVGAMSGGGAAINAFSRTIGASVTLVDVGVATPFSPHPGVVNRRVRSGTDSILRGPAMTTQDAAAAIQVGADIASDLIDNGADCLIGGEMGIGNTTPSVALISAITGCSPRDLTGPGAGVPAEGIDHKMNVIDIAVSRIQGWADPLELLAEIGGLEIAALAGFYMTAAQRRMPFIVDGMIACAALCVADLLAPGTGQRAIAGHRSQEPAATAALNHLNLQPLLDLELRLGEGTGAVLAFPLLVAATQALTDMAALSDL